MQKLQGEKELLEKHRRRMMPTEREQVEDAVSALVEMVEALVNAEMEQQKAEVCARFYLQRNHACFAQYLLVTTIDDVRTRLACPSNSIQRFTSKTRDRCCACQTGHAS